MTDDARVREIARKVVEDWLQQCGPDKLVFRFEQSELLQQIIARAIAALPPQSAMTEVARLRRDCAELHQVIGTLDELVPEIDKDVTVKALDNASAAANGDARPHEDLLPFILKSHQPSAQPGNHQSSTVAEHEALRDLVLDTTCPGGGWNGMPVGMEATVKNCLVFGNCGCKYGSAIRAMKGGGGER